MPRAKQIFCKHVSKSMKLHTGRLNLILKDISFRWAFGESIGVIGLNGAGKSTLLRLIGQFEKPTTGEIIYDPKNTQVATVFQRPEDHFIFETVKRQISSHARRRLSLDELFEIIDRVGLSKDLLFLPPYSLSSGQQRLVAIASALAKKADFIILDEPMAGLDAPSRKLVSEALTSLSRDKQLGVMFVSHHPDDLLGFVDRLLILFDNTILYDGSLEHVQLEALYTCVAKTDASLLLFLKRLEEGQHRVTPGSYHSPSPDQVASMIEGVLKS